MMQVDLGTEYYQGRINMEILVCVKKVPDTAEQEFEVNHDGFYTDKISKM
jgi:hypothetical protein